MTYALHAVIVKKPVNKNRLNEIREHFINSREKSFMRETGQSFRIRNHSKQKFISKTFRTKKVNPNVSLIFGKLKPEWVQLEEHANKVRHLKGSGVLDYFKNKLNQVGSTISSGVKSVKDYFSPKLNDYNNKSKANIIKYGSSPVLKMHIYRTPLSSKVNTFLNLLSFGRLAGVKKKYGFDDFFHLALVCTIGNKHVMCQKNSVVDITENYKTTELTEVFDVNMKGKQFTLNDMLNKTQSRMGDKAYFEYDMLSHNCQNYVANLLISVGLYTPDVEAFVYQNIAEIIKEIPEFSKRLIRGATDLDATINKLTGGVEPDEEHPEVNNYNINDDPNNNYDITNNAEVPSRAFTHAEGVDNTIPQIAGLNLDPFRGQGKKFKTKILPVDYKESKIIGDRTHTHKYNYQQIKEETNKRKLLNYINEYNSEILKKHNDKRYNDEMNFLRERAEIAEARLLELESVHNNNDEKVDDSDLPALNWHEYSDQFLEGQGKKKRKLKGGVTVPTNNNNRGRELTPEEIRENAMIMQITGGLTPAQFGAFFRDQRMRNPNPPLERALRANNINNQPPPPPPPPAPPAGSGKKRGGSGKRKSDDNSERNEIKYVLELINDIDKLSEGWINIRVPPIDQKHINQRINEYLDIRRNVLNHYSEFEKGRLSVNKLLDVIRGYGNELEKYKEYLQFMINGKFKDEDITKKYKAPPMIKGDTQPSSSSLTVHSGSEPDDDSSSDSGSGKKKGGAINNVVPYGRPQDSMKQRPNISDGEGVVPNKNDLLNRTALPINVPRNPALNIKPYDRIVGSGFHIYTLAQLKQIVKAFELHTKIKMTGLKREQLLTEIEKHLIIKGDKIYIKSDNFDMPKFKINKKMEKHVGVKPKPESKSRDIKEEIKALIKEIKDSGDKYKIDINKNEKDINKLNEMIKNYDIKMNKKKVNKPVGDFIFSGIKERKKTPYTPEMKKELNDLLDKVEEKRQDVKRQDVKRQDVKHPDLTSKTPFLMKHNEDDIKLPKLSADMIEKIKSKIHPKHEMKKEVYAVLKQIEEGKQYIPLTGHNHMIMGIILRIMNYEL
jgi:hypothetical protein